MTFTLNESSLAAMHAHAREAYPDECCGMIIERDHRVEIVRVSNVQNDLHAQDPDQFPRTAATGYTMGPEAAPILIRSERGELRRPPGPHGPRVPVDPPGDREGSRENQGPSFTHRRIIP